MRLVITVAAAALLAMGVGACGEKSQVVVYKQGKYQGKPDGRPWENEPLTAEWRGGKWNKGDRASWEEQIKHRQLAQHEDTRINQ